MDLHIPILTNEKALENDNEPPRSIRGREFFV
jgi:hypothetical protein